MGHPWVINLSTWVYRWNPAGVVERCEGKRAPTPCELGETGLESHRGVFHEAHVLRRKESAAQDMGVVMLLVPENHMGMWQN